jgi:hypothetical protein
VDPANRNTALASAMVEELARCGVRRAVISPGSRSTPLAVALWRQPEIEATVILDERSAGFFALGTALATGIPAAVLCTSGSAAANLHELAASGIRRTTARGVIGGWPNPHPASCLTASASFVRCLAQARRRCVGRNRPVPSKPAGSEEVGSADGRLVAEG